MAGRTPEERVPVPLARQEWVSTTFLHWPFEPGIVQRLLPEGLRVDERQGAAWVSLTPFVLARFRPPVGPAIPRLATFPETNLRTYAVGPDGRDGIWFLDIEVASALMAGVMRTVLDLPYDTAAMSVDESGPIRYRSERSVDGGTVGHDITVAPGPRLADDGEDSLDQWLAGRWRAFSRRAGRLLATPVRHEPWDLHAAELLACEENLLDHVGLEPGQPPIVRFAPSVSVRLGPPSPVRGSA